MVFLKCNMDAMWEAYNQDLPLSIHPKKISLYLHTLLVISRRTLSKNTQLGVLCQAALVVMYHMYLLAIPFHMKLGGGGRIKIVGGPLRSRCGR
jgi:hypothetical protein